MHQRQCRRRRGTHSHNDRVLAQVLKLRVAMTFHLETGLIGQPVKNQERGLGDVDN